MGKTGEVIYKDINVNFMNGHDEGREEKQRIEKDTNEFMKTMEVESTTTNKLYRSIYIAGATAENNRLREQLAKERELRKELVEMLERCRGITEHYGMYSTNKEIEALIKKGT